MAWTINNDKIKGKWFDKKMSNFSTKELKKMKIYTFKIPIKKEG
jgi:hypothetical protein